MAAEALRLGFRMAFIIEVGRLYLRDYINTDLLNLSFEGDIVYPLLDWREKDYSGLIQTEAVRVIQRGRTRIKGREKLVTQQNR